ncbi:MAG: hypothetical protein ACYDEA_03075 [Candidatus Dormibacteria bacterium]
MRLDEALIAIAELRSDQVGFVHLSLVSHQATTTAGALDPIGMVRDPRLT